MPEEEVDFSSISKYFLHLLKWKKNTKDLSNVYENINLSDF